MKRKRTVLTNGGGAKSPFDSPVRFSIFGPDSFVFVGWDDDCPAEKYYDIRIDDNIISGFQSGFNYNEPVVINDTEINPDSVFFYDVVQAKLASPLVISSNGTFEGPLPATTRFVIEVNLINNNEEYSPYINNSKCAEGVVVGSSWDSVNAYLNQDINSGLVAEIEIEYKRNNDDPNDFYLSRSIEIYV